jgi:hypothetical protein
MFLQIYVNNVSDAGIKVSSPGREMVASLVFGKSTLVT